MPSGVKQASPNGSGQRRIFHLSRQDEHIREMSLLASWHLVYRLLVGCVLLFFFCLLVLYHFHITIPHPNVVLAPVLSAQLAKWERAVEVVQFFEREQHI